MLKHVAPWFEHRLFLTATPHNGHTRSFTGLLETLDPVRFTRKSDPLSESERGRVEQVVVRLLKSEINERSSPPRFARRDLRAIPLVLGNEERALSVALDAFRRRVRSLVARGKRSEQLAGAFAVEVLGKRLLSCPVAFADSWQRYRDGFAEQEAAATGEILSAQRAVREDTPDEREAEGRAAHAARVVDTWLKPLAADLQGEMQALDEAFRALGLGADAGSPVSIDPRHDARFDTLRTWIETNLHAGRRGSRLAPIPRPFPSADHLPTLAAERHAVGRTDTKARMVARASHLAGRSRRIKDACGAKSKAVGAHPRRKTPRKTPKSGSWLSRLSSQCGD